MSKDALETGDVIQDGPNAGWIYCDGKGVEPFLVAPNDSGAMKWREAMNFAERDGSKLPTKEQLNSMYEVRNTGVLKGTFNQTGSFPAGWYWSATEIAHLTAWCQNFSDGYQHNGTKSLKSFVRCVRRYSIA